MAKENGSVVYKEIPGFPGYRVGDDGSVWSSWKRHDHTYIQSSRWKQLKPMPGAWGLKVELTGGKSKLIHRLVLEAFVGPCPEGLETCHNDGDFTNNKLENLRWDTHKENCADRIKHGTAARGETHGKARFTEEGIKSLRKEYAAGGVTYRSLAAKYDVHHSSIYSIVRKRNWKNVD